MRFLLIDRVSYLERSKHIKAYRSVSLSEDFFADHFPGNPIMPASLILEAFAQTGTCLLETSSEFQKKGLPGFIQSAKFSRPVVPGHELEIEMTVDSSLEDGVLLSGFAHQRGERCASIRLGMLQVPFRSIIPDSFATFYLSIYETWLHDAKIEGFNGHPLEALRHVIA